MSLTRSGVIRMSYQSAFEGGVLFRARVWANIIYRRLNLMSGNSYTVRRSRSSYWRLYEIPNDILSEWRFMVWIFPGAWGDDRYPHVHLICCLPQGMAHIISTAKSVSWRSEALDANLDIVFQFLSVVLWNFDGKTTSAWSERTASPILCLFIF